MEHVGGICKHSDGLHIYDIQHTREYYQTHEDKFTSPYHSEI